MWKHGQDTAGGSWETPQWLFEKLDRAFGFTLDVAASPENAKCDRYYTVDEDGLHQTWTGRIWMNPPYSRDLGKWAQKAYEAMLAGNLVVGLLPVRTDTRWWQKYVIPHAVVHYLAGRIKFNGSRKTAPFPCAVVIWWPKP